MNFKDAAIPLLQRAKEVLSTIYPANYDSGICWALLCALQEKENEIVYVHAEKIISRHIQDELGSHAYFHHWFRQQHRGYFLLAHDERQNFINLARCAWIDKMIYNLETTGEL